MAKAAEAVPQQQEPATLPQLARAWLKRCDGDTVRATALLQQSLERDGDLLRQVIKAAIADACGMHVQAAARHERAAIIKQTTASGRDGVVALANGITRALLDMRLPNGVVLRNATRGEVLDSANRYQASAADMSRKARWLVLVAQSVPNDSTVGDVMNDARAAELWNEVA